MRMKANTILDSLINKHFKELKSVLITIEKEKSNDSIAAVSMQVYKKQFVIFIDNDFSKLSINAKQACLVHELCHIRDFMRRNIFSILYDTIMCDISKKYLTKIERNIDMQCVELGYAQGLLELVKFHDNIYENYDEKDGLTKKELKKILKK